MALQSSGTISINDIATEFGGTAPHSLNEYYRGGGLVPDTAANAGIPSSGQVSLDDFYGGDVVSGALGAVYATSTINKYQVVPGVSTSIQGSPQQSAATGSNYVFASFWGNNFNGASHVIKSDGRLWTWGRTDCMLYPVVSPAVTTSTPVSPDTNTDWVQAHAVGYGAIGVRGNGGAYFVWPSSSASYPIWGVGSSVTAVTQVSTHKSWVQATSGFQHCVLLASDGRAWATGIGYRVGVGYSGAITASSGAELAGGTTNWTFIDQSFSHGLGLRSDGRLWGWGENSQGIIGNGTTTTQLSPVEVSGGHTNWETVSTGWTGTCAVKSDGRMWIWGAYRSGGSAVSASVPTEVAGGGTNWADGRADMWTTTNYTALKTDGRIWSWGNDNNHAINSAQDSPYEHPSAGTGWQALGNPFGTTGGLYIK